MQRIIGSPSPRPRPRGVTFLSALLAAALLLAACDGGAPTPTPTATPPPTATAALVVEPATVTPSPPTATPTTPAAEPTATPAPAPATPTPAPTSAPTPTPARSFLPIPDPPRGDPIELAERLKYGGGTDLAPLAPSETELAVGHVEEFHVLDVGELRPFTVEAELRLVSEHAYFYVERGARIRDSQLEASARELEEHIIPTIRRLVNPDWEPGAGIDSRLTILNARIPNVAGYYNLLDTLPKAVNELSNERPMVYLSLLAVQPGGDRYHGVLTHELQHAAQADADPFETAWVHEGAAEYAAAAAGYRGGREGFFFVPPGIQLTLWPDEHDAVGPHYGAAYGFMTYLAQRVGEDAFASLLTSPLTGAEGVESFLAQQGFDADFDAFFLEWTVDNLKRALALAGNSFGAGLRSRDPGNGRSRAGGHPIRRGLCPCRFGRPRPPSRLRG